MPTSFDAGYRLFLHNPPSESSAGSPAVRYQHGPRRAGVQEWRTSDYEAAVRKAERIVAGTDADNALKPDGWITIDRNDGDRWTAIRVLRPAPALVNAPPERVDDGYRQLATMGRAAIVWVSRYGVSREQREAAAKWIAYHDELEAARSADAVPVHVCGPLCPEHGDQRDTNIDRIKASIPDGQASPL